MKHWWPLRALKFVVFAITMILIFSYAFMLLWNALIPDLFRGPLLTYWQALGLLVLSHFLFRGWSPWHHGGGWRHRRWKHRLDERMASMTPEEREKFRQEWRRRCGWYPGEESEPKSQANA